MIDWIDIDQLHLGTAVKRHGIPRLGAHDLDQMQKFGAIVPVSARPVSAGHYEILAGAETWLCAQRLGHDQVPVYIVDEISDEQAGTLRFSTATDPISEAESFAQQLARWQGARRGRIAGLARLLGLNRAYVAHALRLLRLPETVKNAVRQGKLSAGHARAILRLPRADQPRAARRIRREAMTVRQAEAFVRGERSKNQTRDPDIARLEERVSQLLGCDFRVAEGEGTCTIDYQRDLEILDGVLEKLGYQE